MLAAALYVRIGYEIGKFCGHAAAGLIKRIHRGSLWIKINCHWQH
jgi:hypothetical protein